MEKFPSGYPSEVRASNPKEIEAVLKGVDGLAPDALDALPFGMIQLDVKGNILSFNKTEAALARLNQQRQIGKNFFEEVAPCTRVKEFYGVFASGVARKSLYETFGFVFKFEHGWRNVAVTLMYSQVNQAVWVLVSQAEGK